MSNNVIGRRGSAFAAAVDAALNGTTIASTNITLSLRRLPDPIMLGNGATGCIHGGYAVVDVGADEISGGTARASADGSFYQPKISYRQAVVFMYEAGKCDPRSLWNDHRMLAEDIVELILRALQPTSGTNYGRSNIRWGAPSRTNDGNFYINRIEYTVQEWWSAS